MRTRFGAATMVVCALLILCMTLPAVAQTTLLSSSLPGAFGVRYLEDRAVVTYTVEDPGDRVIADNFRLQVRLPEPVQWGYLDREPMPTDRLRWDADTGQVVLSVPFGSHRLHLGWTGEPSLPPDATSIPVAVDGRRAGDLTARFDLESMTATGEVPIGPGHTAVRLELREELPPDAITFSAGEESVRRWIPVDGGLRSEGRLMIDDSPNCTLQVRAYALRESPVGRVVFEDVQPPTRFIHIPDFEITDDMVMIPAEDFTEMSGTAPRVEPGLHHPTITGSTVGSFIGDGTWIEWTFAIPQDGLYDLYTRVACGDTGAWRVIWINDEIPEGFELVEFPGTGGWGYSDAEWWNVRLTGGENQPSPLQLSAGEHTLRMRGVLTKHLNMDVIVFVPHE